MKSNNNYNDTNIKTIDNYLTQLKSILNERGGSYGSYNEVAKIQTQIIDLLRSAEGYNKLKPSTILAIEMIIHKIIRLVNSGKEKEDTLLDIAGYTLLALAEIKEDNKQRD